MSAFTERWFKSGERLGYDAQARAVDGSASQKVFVRVDGDPTHAVTFLPGFPDGSIGWGKVLPYLPDVATMPKLFVEYLGMGDSDKPRDYTYSTAERTDLVEALWRHFGVESTTLVAFDFSSLVVLEHFARRLEDRSLGPVIRGVFLFNGGLFTDGHSHPWFTTPLLQRMPIDQIPRLATPPFFTFRLTARVMWSKHYARWEDDARDVYSAMSRNDGLFFLYRARLRRRPPFARQPSRFWPHLRCVSRRLSVPSWWKCRRSIRASPNNARATAAWRSRIENRSPSRRPSHHERAARGACAPRCGLLLANHARRR